MNRLISILLTLFLLLPSVTGAEELGLFHRGAAAALGIAERSAQKGLELDAISRAKADPAHAEEILRKAGVVQGVMESAGDSLFEEATGIDVGHKRIGSYKHTKPSSNRLPTRTRGKNITQSLAEIHGMHEPESVSA